MFGSLTTAPPGQTPGYAVNPSLAAASASVAPYQATDPRVQIDLDVAIANCAEYKRLICLHALPHVMSRFETMFLQSIELARQHDIMPKRVDIFLQNMREIESWDAFEKDQYHAVKPLSYECNMIEQRLPWLRQVLFNFIVNQCAVLLALRFGQHTSDNAISIRFPKIDRFVHVVFINASRVLSSFSHLLDSTPWASFQIAVKDVVRASIEDSIEMMVPIENIARVYFGDVRAVSLLDYEPARSKIQNDVAYGVHNGSASSSTLYAPTPTTPMSKTAQPSSYFPPLPPPSSLSSTFAAYPGMMRPPFMPPLTSATAPDRIPISSQNNVTPGFGATPVSASAPGMPGDANPTNIRVEAAAPPVVKSASASSSITQAGGSSEPTVNSVAKLPIVEQPPLPTSAPVPVNVISSHTNQEHLATNTVVTIPSQLAVAAAVQRIFGDAYRATLFITPDTDISVDVAHIQGRPVSFSEMKDYLTV